MSDEDSLVATRSRRSNAGSRLKHLIELEERASDVQESVSSIINEEDENVNLLFQEDEDDQEFFEEDEDEDEENEEEEEEREGHEEDNIEEEEENKKRSHESDDEVEQVNSDDVLSDSDISMSDSDESEGEKELQKQEKMKQKRVKKKQSLVPTIKQPKLDEKPKAKKPKGLTSSDSLLLSMRRSSSRSTAVENKEALVQKLKENEKRRANVAPIVRVKHVDLTQEEKLAEAIETEKANILSLQQFRDQEIVKKERQKQLLLSRKVQLKNVIRMVSDERLITPLDEINEDRHMRELMNIRSRKKLGRKKKVTNDSEVKRLPGEVDTELPIVKQELEQKRIQEERESKSNQIEETAETTAVSQNDDSNEENKNIEIDNITPPSKESSELSEQVDVSKEVTGESISNEEVETQTITEDDKNANPNISREATIKENTASNSNQASENDEVIDNDLDNNDEKLTENDSVSNSKPNVDAPIKEEQSSNDDLINESSKEDTNKPKDDDGETQAAIDSIVSDEENLLNNKGDESNEVKEEKRVKFADELEQEQREGTEPYDTNYSPSDAEFEIIPETFEGPPQRVARNTIYLIDFEEDKDPSYKLDIANIKAMLFGSQSLLPASRRFKDLKTILRIGEVENPYATVKQEKDELFEPVSELTEDNAMFDELKRLPKLGITQAVVEEIEEDTQEENAPIVLKTEAPTGIYLPNGNKKVCLISGTEVKYFDPSNGIPYSSVETYRFLKTIEQGNVPWYSIDEVDNDNGPVEIYLGSRDGTEKHAKGVPEGFDS
ncbi:DEHA2F12122p [Debaryomyces hansenii CBS767]|uniref:DEHA2F12122p n=1 Tax=Debaryomyces hansenii (strain ATCC 36239 / CBS 767 / BCRC 21394 / JCM 1990 / NBRC 0083 / IGC 2968) TaxID=284592 RepID=Q6BLN0_DEBHA|nr:DEHA2F12122p [Debaryomyces hansenii CBS767]CAG89241.2 DEHA2F12122p [Debaryomyces hansenii CBS767]|eukprot:XP_460891.2 DEHA2F12122p [Debaryomyces hansenii CBS767]